MDIIGVKRKILGEERLENPGYIIRGTNGPLKGWIVPVYTIKERPYLDLSQESDLPDDIIRHLHDGKYLDLSYYYNKYEKETYKTWGDLNVYMTDANYVIRGLNGPLRGWIASRYMIQGNPYADVGGLTSDLLIDELIIKGRYLNLTAYYDKYDRDVIHKWGIDTYVSRTEYLMQGRQGLLKGQIVDICTIQGQYYADLSNWTRYNLTDDITNLLLDGTYLPLLSYYSLNEHGLKRDWETMHITDIYQIHGHGSLHGYQVRIYSILGEYYADLSPWHVTEFPYEVTHNLLDGKYLDLVSYYATEHVNMQLIQIDYIIHGDSGELKHWVVPLYIINGEYYVDISSEAITRLVAYIKVPQDIIHVSSWTRLRLLYGKYLHLINYYTESNKGTKEQWANYIKIQLSTIPKYE